MGKLDGKVAVVTGAGSGIGEATARLFVTEGARVVVADIDETNGKAVGESLGAAGAFVTCDVSQEEDVKRAISTAIGTFGSLDIVFNNAGLGGVNGGIAEIPVEGFDATIAVLLRGVFLGMKHAAPHLVDQGSGSIISTASVAGLTAGYGPHVYSAAKAAVVNLTRSVAMELAEHGVRVNCICPGGIATSIFGHGVRALMPDVSPEVEDQVNQMVKGILPTVQPIKRAGMPDDIARAALWLASDDASFVTGQAIVVDGGLVAGRKWGQGLPQQLMANIEAASPLDPAQ